VKGSTRYVLMSSGEFALNGRITMRMKSRSQNITNEVE
jgi:hypothetical protein